MGPSKAVWVCQTGKGFSRLLCRGLSHHLQPDPFGWRWQWLNLGSPACWRDAFLPGYGPSLTSDGRFQQVYYLPAISLLLKKNGREEVSLPSLEYLKLYSVFHTATISIHWCEQNAAFPWCNFWSHASSSWKPYKDWHFVWSPWWPPTLWVSQIRPVLQVLAPSFLEICGRARWSRLQEHFDKLCQGGSCATGLAQWGGTRVLEALNTDKYHAYGSGHHQTL